VLWLSTLYLIKKKIWVEGQCSVQGRKQELVTIPLAETCTAEILPESGILLVGYHIAHNPFSLVHLSKSALCKLHYYVFLIIF